jgi:hypothetical protein
MKQTELLQLTSQSDGASLYRQTIGKVKNLPLSLAIIQNDKVLKEVADDVRETLKTMEPPELEKLRNEAKKVEGDELLNLQRDFNRQYNDFITSPDVQAFLKSENDLKLKQVTLDEKYVKNAGFDSDQIEILMLFTNIQEVIEKIDSPVENKAEKKLHTQRKK